MFLKILFISEGDWPTYYPHLTEEETNGWASITCQGRLCEEMAEPGWNGVTGVGAQFWGQRASAHWGTYAAFLQPKQRQGLGWWVNPLPESEGQALEPGSGRGSAEPRLFPSRLALQHGDGHVVDYLSQPVIDYILKSQLYINASG